MSHVWGSAWLVGGPKKAFWSLAFVKGGFHTMIRSFCFMMARGPTPKKNKTEFILISSCQRSHEMNFFTECRIHVSSWKKNTMGGTWVKINSSIYVAMRVVDRVPTFIMRAQWMLAKHPKENLGGMPRQMPSVWRGGSLASEWEPGPDSVTVNQHDLFSNVYSFLIICLLMLG